MDIDNAELNSSTATTQSQSDNSTKVATTAYVDTGLNNQVTAVSSTDNAVVRFDGTSGQVQDSTATIDDSGNIDIQGDITVSGTGDFSDVVTITSDNDPQLVVETLSGTSNDAAIKLIGARDLMQTGTDSPCRIEGWNTDSGYSVSPDLIGYIAYENTSNTIPSGRFAFYVNDGAGSYTSPLTMETGDVTFNVDISGNPDIGSSTATTQSAGDNSTKVATTEYVDTAVAGAGDVTAASNITDNALVRGDGGAKGVQDSGVIIDDSDNVSGIGTLDTTGDITLSGSGNQYISCTIDTDNQSGFIASTLSHDWIMGCHGGIGNVFKISNSTSFSTNDILTVNGTTTATFSNSFEITDTTASTSSTTGSLIVGGGMGISGDINSTATASFVKNTTDPIISAEAASNGNDGIIRVLGRRTSAQTGQSPCVVEFYNADSNYSSNPKQLGAVVFNNTSDTVPSGRFKVFINDGTDSFTTPIQATSSNLILSQLTDVTDTTDSTSSTTGALTTSGGLGVAKKLYVGTGIYLPTSGGTASELNYYEEDEVVSSAFSGGWGLSLTRDVTYNRIGNRVTVTCDVSITATAISSSVYMRSTAYVPARFRPPANRYGAVEITNNNSLISTPGKLEIDTSGNITIYYDWANASWPTTFGTRGLANGFNITYTV